MIGLPLALALIQAPAGATREFIKVPGPKVALTHVRLVDGTGAPPADDQTILINGDRIAWTGPRWKSSALVAPVTQNSPRPIASKKRTPRRTRSSSGMAKKQTSPAAPAAAR